ncbi:Dph6-related ATP pyrophosphatase [Bhargavaea cecembensis]|nr:diphthine--ammonia ligase [Bhargavaea cecembensis]
MNNQPFFASWSGGKDSALALHRAIQNGGRPERLLTMFDSGGDRSKSHAVSEAIIREQANAIGIPLVIRRSGWTDYREQFLSGLDEMKVGGIQTGVFGDIDLEDHRKWVADTCAERGIEAVHPLWGMGRTEVVRSFLDAGFRATVVVGHDERFPAEWVGRTFDHQLIRDMESLGIDPCGEAGEFHTLVTDGPVFKDPLRLNQADLLKRDGYSFARMELSE